MRHKITISFVEGSKYCEVLDKSELCDNHFQRLVILKGLGLSINLLKETKVNYYRKRVTVTRRCKNCQKFNTVSRRCTYLEKDAPEISKVNPNELTKCSQFENKFKTETVIKHFCTIVDSYDSYNK